MKPDSWKNAICVHLNNFSYFEDFLQKYEFLNFNKKNLEIYKPLETFSIIFFSVIAAITETCNEYLSFYRVQKSIDIPYKFILINDRFETFMYLGP